VLSGRRTRCRGKSVPEYKNAVCQRRLGWSGTAAMKSSVTRTSSRGSSQGTNHAMRCSQSISTGCFWSKGMTIVWQVCGPHASVQTPRHRVLDTHACTAVLVGQVDHGPPVSAKLSSRYHKAVCGALSIAASKSAERSSWPHGRSQAVGCESAAGSARTSIVAASGSVTTRSCRAPDTRQPC
jgi:hypothetical protein